MGDIGVAQQGDGWSILIDYPDGSNHLYGHIACGIGCGVSDLMAYLVVMESTLPLASAVPLPSTASSFNHNHQVHLLVGGGCRVGDVGVPNQGDHWWCVILDLDGPGDWNRRVPTAVCISVSDLMIETGD